MLDKKKKEKEEYNELMDKLEKEAFVKMVQMEQEKAEKQRLKEEEERKRKREEKARIKRMLEAAFEGDVDEMAQVLKEVVDLDNKNNVGNDVIGRNIRDRHLTSVVECEDANENTPLSEAASGGNVEAITFLLEKGADPNKIGQFMRTPLYRAAFAGHLDACQVLLQNGADPRPYASDGQTPAQIASSPAIVELIEGWDISQTEKLMEKMESEKSARKEQDRLRREAETNILENILKDVQEDYDMHLKKLNFAYCELNKRIYEHDTAPAMGFEKPEITIQAIKDQECEVEILKINVEKARDKLANAKLKLREQQKGGEEGADLDDLPGLKVTMKELDDVLMRDVGNRIKDSGKWPLIIDTHGQAATFLRYRDTNYICTLSPHQMEPEIIRLAVIGSIRYGKPLVIDMMEVDMFHAVGKRFDDVTEGLLDSMMDKSIMQEEKYIKLIKPTDPPDYSKDRFIDSRTANFRLFIITKNPFPPEDLMDQTYPIRIHVPV